MRSSTLTAMVGIITSLILDLTLCLTRQVLIGMEDKLIAAAKKHGAVMFIAGRFRVDYTFNDGQWREITIKQTSHFDNSDLYHTRRLVSKGTIQIAPLIQDVVPVTEAKRVYGTLRDEPKKLFGTVFDWRQI